MVDNNVELNRMIGERLREARQLCGHTIGKAARLLGIEPVALQDAEGGKGVSVELLRRASETYAVSADYILGLTNSVTLRDEEDLQRFFLANLHASLTDTQSQITAELIGQQVKIDALCDSVRALTPAIEGINQAVERFRERNAEFDDMAASNSVIVAIGRAKIAANKAITLMVREGLLSISAMAAVHEN